MEFEKQFDEKFDCDLSQDGVAKWTINEKLLDGQIMRYRARKEDIKDFIRKLLSQSIEEEREQIRDKIKHLKFQNQLAMNVVQWNLSRKNKECNDNFDDLINSLRQGE